MKISLIAIFTFILSLSLINAMEKNSLAIESKLIYKDYFELVTTVSPQSSQFCRRAAALTLMGDYAQATQYEEDWGECMRNIIKKVSRLNGEYR